MNLDKLDKDRNYHWTMHCQFKLKQYGLSPNKVKRIIRFPDRKEEGIALDTIAVMQRKNRKDPKKGEIWVMYQTKLKTQKSIRQLADKNSTQKSKIHTFESDKIGSSMVKFNRTKIISAWVFPGVSPKGKEIFVPDDVWDEIISNS